MKRLLESRIILITGAGSGLGRQAALAFASQGATVLLLGRDENRLNMVYDAVVREENPQPVVIPLDLAHASEADFHSLARMIENELGRLDGILHSAVQFVPLTPLSQLKMSDLQNGLATNFTGPFGLTRMLLPLLELSSDASVLFTMEEHALNPGPYWGGLGTSQMGLAHLARLFTQERRAHSSVRFNVLIPGPVATPLRKRTHPGMVASELPAPSDLMHHYVHWMGPESQGKSGEIIILGTTD